MQAAATPLFTDADVISAYSRAEAIEDGSLVDVSGVAREAGFGFPVAMTRAAWEDCVAWSDADTARQRVPQDEDGRLWDVLYMAANAARGAPDRTCRLPYSLFRVPRGGKARTARPVGLHLVTGPGDDAEPVATIMLPNES